MFTVKQTYQRIRKSVDGSDEHYRDAQSRGKSEVSYFPDGFHISFSVAVAHDRLRSLRHSVEDCHCHKRKVRDHSVSRHTDISHKTEHQEIEHGRDDSGRNLPHKCRDAKLTRPE